jgi:hypothetical protein
VGNGRASVISRAGDAGDSNGNRAWLLNGLSKPDRVFGLEFGGSYYDDLVTLSSGSEFRERIVASYAAWLKEDPELIFEYAGVRHREQGTDVVNWNHGYYIQAAYRLPQFKRLLKPYYRFEHIDIADGDAMFATVPELDMHTVGLRYDASLFAAIKGEYRTWTRGELVPRNHGGFFQVAFTF